MLWEWEHPVHSGVSETVHIAVTHTGVCDFHNNLQHIHVDDPMKSKLSFYTCVWSLSKFRMCFDKFQKRTHKNIGFFNLHMSNFLRSRFWRSQGHLLISVWSHDEWEMSVSWPCARHLSNIPHDCRYILLSVRVRSYRNAGISSRFVGQNYFEHMQAYEHDHTFSLDEN